MNDLAITDIDGYVTYTADTAAAIEQQIAGLKLGIADGSTTLGLRFGSTRQLNTKLSIDLLYKCRTVNTLGQAGAAKLILAAYKALCVLNNTLTLGRSHGRSKLNCLVQRIFYIYIVCRYITLTGYGSDLYPTIQYLQNLITLIGTYLLNDLAVGAGLLTYIQFAAGSCNNCTQL